MPRAAPLALLLALAALLAPTAFAATCVYCNGNTRLSCYTGFPIAPTCTWWGSSNPVSLKHCGTIAHCDDLLTRDGVTYSLKVCAAAAAEAMQRRLGCLPCRNATPPALPHWCARVNAALHPSHHQALTTCQPP